MSALVLIVLIGRLGSVCHSLPRQTRHRAHSTPSIMQDVMIMEEIVTNNNCFGNNTNEMSKSFKSIPCKTGQKRKKRDKKLNEVKLENYFLPQERHCSAKPKKTYSSPTIVQPNLNGTNERNAIKIENGLSSPIGEKNDITTVSSSSGSSVGFLKMSPYSKGSKNTRNNEISPKQKNTSNPVHVQTVDNLLIEQTDTKTNSVGKHVLSTIKTKKRKGTPKQINSQKLTDFFPIRRSSRKPKSVLNKEKENQLFDAILSNREDNMEVVEFSNKGRGVIATKDFVHGEFVVEYAGDLITWTEAKQREAEYALDPRVGCYMYYFNSRQQNYCIDATAESGRFGRLLNHSRRSPNCYTRLIWVPDTKSGKELPRLAIMAKRDIKCEEELTYDYGDRDKSAIAVHPWLKS